MAINVVNTYNISNIADIILTTPSPWTASSASA
jgi:hypothetical protein